MTLTKIEKKLLLHLASCGSSSVSEAAGSADFQYSADSARTAAETLTHLGFATKENIHKTYIEYTDEGQKAQEQGLAEVRLLKILSEGDVKITDLDLQLRQFGISWAKKNGWVQTSNGMVALTSAGEQALNSSEFSQLPKDPSELLDYPKELLGDFERRGLVKISSKVEDTVLAITAEGRQQAAKISDADDDEISSLNRHMLISGAWRTKEFSKYDVGETAGEQLAPRRHPINRLGQKIRDIFLEMGFEEMQGPLCEAAFWNFDSLFQPQDHPARDLADTFYLNGKAELPDSHLVANVKKSHESGWKYSWDSEESTKYVLRTHTTAVSARTLYSRRNDPTPKKFFSLGKVFRNEATDYKHLAEFHQVEGIISWEGATFRHLLGTLKEFYSRLGFDKIRFRPSYFPYTEPSLEIEVFYPDKKEWIELGGAGILRPEVTLPLCSKYPVLAWGLSLERPLMLSNEISDIRTFYRNDLNWLRTFKTRL